MIHQSPSLESLVAELRSNAGDDVELAQRVALVCCTLVEEKAHPVAAIRAVFRLE